MLVLTRKVEEKILIGDDIVITICRICDPAKVKVGIEAPEELVVRRLTRDGHFENGQGQWQRDKPKK